MKLPVVKIPDPILRKKAQKVKKITPELVQLAKNMLETMDENNGIGLAAPQIGHSIRLFVARLKKDDEDKESEEIPETILFNPEIIQKSRSRTKMTEGCLSIPKLTGVVERPSAVTVAGINENGKKVVIAAEGLYARVIQHEIDHLDGILFTDRLRKYTVVFYGTSEFALPALIALHAHPQFNIAAIVTETDKPGGRNHLLLESAVKQYARTFDLPLLQPESLNIAHRDAQKALIATKTVEKIRALSPDFQIVASYGKILPQNVLDIAKSMNINIHPSLLPRYRGPSPIQSALQNGDTETGIAIMQMKAEMDAGPLLSMYKYPIHITDDFGTLTARLSQLAAKQLIISLEDIIADKAELWEQNHDAATFTKKFAALDGKIDWSESPKNIVNQIRALSPKPGAYTEVLDMRIKILKAHLVDNALVIDMVQLPGKNQMSLADLKNGYPHLLTELTKLISSK